MINIIASLVLMAAAPGGWQAEGKIVQVTLPVGRHVIELMVINGQGLPDCDEKIVTVWPGSLGQFGRYWMGKCEFTGDGVCNFRDFAAWRRVI